MLDPHADGRTVSSLCLFVCLLGCVIPVHFAATLTGHLTNKRNEPFFFAPAALALAATESASMASTTVSVPAVAPPMQGLARGTALHNVSAENDQDLMFMAGASSISSFMVHASC